MIGSKLSSEKRVFTRKQKRMTFYILMFALPLLQFLIFYIYVNFNSIIIAFQKQVDGNVSFTSKNFKTASDYFFSSKGAEMMWNSLQLLLCQLFIVTPLGLLFSYYIAKGKRGASFYRIMLYLPQVLSLVVLAPLFKFIVNEVYPYIADKFFNNPNATGLLGIGASSKTIFYTALVFTLWFSFGANVLIYTGAMSGIDQSIVESAQLDGVTTMQEFWHIYLPITFPTITTFILTSLAGIFNNQMSLHIFYGPDSNIRVFGYYFYRMASINTQSVKTLKPDAVVGQYMTLGQLAALGLIATLILVPLTLFARKCLNKLGPSVE